MLGHLHLLMDYYGSGPGWHIHYLWAVWNYQIWNPRGWEFFSWENLLVAAVFLGWTVWIAVVEGRTPVETITRDLDRRIVVSLRRLCGKASSG